MKKLNRKDIGRLLKINPENFLIVNTNYQNEIEVVGRLLKTSAGLALIIYKDLKDILLILQDSQMPL